MNQKERIGYIDVAKGIGMIMVIVGHCMGAPLHVNRVIFSVHMPLFFILAGFFSLSIRRDPFRKFLKKTCVSLLVPYGLTCLLVLIGKIIWNAAAGEKLFREIPQLVLAGLYGSGARIPEGWETSVYSIGAIWFLLAMFIGRVAFRLILRSKVPWLWALVLFFASYVSTEFVWLPFSLQPGLCSVLFLYIGYVIGSNRLFDPKKVKIPVWIGCTAVWVYCIIHCGVIWMVENFYEYGFLSVIGAVCATYTIVGLSELIDRYARFLGRPLAFVGKNSLGLMCAHLLVLQCWPRYMIQNLMLTHLGWADWVCDMVDLVLASAAVAVVLYYIPWLCRRFFPSRPVKKAKGAI